MASPLSYTLCVVLCICSLQTAVTAKKLEFVLYTHEIRSGPNTTLLLAAGTGAGNTSEASGWGSFITVDNLLMEGPTFDSKLVGRFTGVGVMTTKGGILDGGLLAYDQFRFSSASQYNGSSITIIGNLAFPLGGTWEATILGGTGYFQGYTGYALTAAYLPTSVAPRFVYSWNFYLEK